MSRLLRIDPADALPIWRQIEDGFRRMVAAGALVPGAAVPSVRDLSRELRVNPATVARAYQRLCDSGVLAVRRGEGTYVAHGPPAVREGERARLLREAAEKYVSVAQALGADERASIAEVRETWERPKAMKGGGRR